MAEPETMTQGAPQDLDLRAKGEYDVADTSKKRFDIFLLDTGWNSAVSRLVHSHLTLLWNFERHDTLYILTPEQSVEFLKLAPELIGHDPIIIVYDLRKPTHHAHRNYHGFRLNLGLIRHPEQALARLQEFVRFIEINRSADDLYEKVTKELHREGWKGMIKVIHDASTELL